MNTYTLEKINIYILLVEKLKIPPHRDASIGESMQETSTRSRNMEDGDYKTNSLRVRDLYFHV